VEAVQDESNQARVDALLIKSYGVPDNPESLESARQALESLTPDLPRDQLNDTYTLSAELGMMPADPPVSYDNTVRIPAGDTE
jgi:hypothetical protein